MDTSILQGFHKELNEMTNSNNLVYLLKLRFIPLQKHPVLYLPVSQAFQQSTEPAPPHGAQQRPHKQARNKTGFVSWGEGGQGSQKKIALPTSSPMVNY